MKTPSLQRAVGVTDSVLRELPALTLRTVASQKHSPSNQILYLALPLSCAVSVSVKLLAGSDQRFPQTNWSSELEI